jgi:hypothetical protein
VRVVADIEAEELCLFEDIGIINWLGIMGIDRKKNIC